MPRTRLAVVAVLCLSFTGARAARAEEPHEQPARDKLMGATMEVGSLAGFATYHGESATAIGAEVGGYLRFGPALIGAEYAYLAVGDTPMEGPPVRGALERLGVAARLDVARFDRSFGGPNTALLLWVDGSLGRQFGRWHDDTPIARNDIGVGAGWLLEHRVRLSTRPRTLETIGWKLGWRLTTAPRYGSRLDAIAACADKHGCGPTEHERKDIGMVVTSSVRFDW